jgi:hypothetical protein
MPSSCRGCHQVRSRPGGRPTVLLVREGVSVTELLDIWEFPADFELAKITQIAIDALTEPDLRAHLVSSRGDILTVQVADGKPPADSEMRLYVGGRGAFEITRIERWPGERVLLVLRAWPQRD